MRTALFATLILAAACAKKEAPAPEAPPPPPPVAPPAPTVADFTGNWNAVTMMPNAKPVETQLMSNADGTWSMMAKGRKPIALTMSMSGDSLIAQSAEYESLIRKGVMVNIRTATVRSGSTMNGTVVATYKTKKGDEVVNGTMTATKAP